MKLYKPIYYNLYILLYHEINKIINNAFNKIYLSQNHYFLTITSIQLVSEITDVRYEIY